ncbi:putative trehalose-phosphate phosphatase F-like [Capsicum annuum]|nr:putative trehalose-phosphate phosphatase F-like [Capsicum annuum]
MAGSLWEVDWRWFAAWLKKCGVGWRDILTASWPSIDGATLIFASHSEDQAEGERRKKEEDCYLKRGSSVLQEFLALCDGNCRIPIRYFTAFEIERAIKHSEKTLELFDGYMGELEAEDHVCGTLGDSNVMNRVDSVISKETVDLEEDVESNTEEGNAMSRVDSPILEEKIDLKNIPTNFVNRCIKEGNVMNIADPTILEEHGIEIQQQLNDYLDLVKK